TRYDPYTELHSGGDGGAGLPWGVSHCRAGAHDRCGAARDHGCDPAGEAVDDGAGRRMGEVDAAGPDSGFGGTPPQTQRSSCSAACITGTIAAEIPATA